jgi:hypothetical protein
MGRGTEKQFQIYGSPFLPKSNFSFTPIPNFGAKEPTDADFETEAGVTAWLNRLVVWINAQFAKILGTVPEPNLPVLGTDGKADKAIQSRIKLISIGGNVIAQVS